METVFPSHADLVPYDVPLLSVVKDYAADMAHLAEKEAVAARRNPPYSKELQESLLMDVVDSYKEERDLPAAPVPASSPIERAVWRAAKNIVGSSASWGGLIPGVSMDCAGAVISVTTSAGLYTIPKGVLARLGSCTTRNENMAETELETHRRMVSLLILMMLRFANPEYRSIPVVNSNTLYPGDIFFPANMIVVDGRALYPHSMVCVAPGRLLHASPRTHKVEIVDYTQHTPDANVVGKCAQAQLHSIVFRCINRRKDTIADIHEAKIISRARELAGRANSNIIDTD